MPRFDCWCRNIGEPLWIRPVFLTADSSHLTFNLRTWYLDTMWKRTNKRGGWDISPHDFRECNLRPDLAARIEGSPVAY